MGNTSSSHKPSNPDWSLLACTCLDEHEPGREFAQFIPIEDDAPSPVLCHSQEPPAPAAEPEVAPEVTPPDADAEEQEEPTAAVPLDGIADEHLSITAFEPAQHQIEDMDLEDEGSDESAMTAVSPTKDLRRQPRRLSLLPVHDDTVCGGVEADDLVTELLQEAPLHDIELALELKGIKIAQLVWKETGYNALHVAVVEEREDLLDYCLRHWVDPLHKDKLGRTALNLAYMGGCAALAVRLVQHLDGLQASPLSPYARSSNRSHGSFWQLSAPLDLSPLTGSVPSSQEQDGQGASASGSAANKKKRFGVKRMISKAASRVRRMVVPPSAPQHQHSIGQQGASNSHTSK